ncbi:MAG: hypothetical protein ACK58T_31775 [Phycisphaerae bacterium]|jgi:hypothetical protein
MSEQSLITLPPGQAAVPGMPMVKPCRILWLGMVQLISLTSPRQRMVPWSSTPVRRRPPVLLSSAKKISLVYSTVMEPMAVLNVLVFQLVHFVRLAARALVLTSRTSARAARVHGAFRDG